MRYPKADGGDGGDGGDVVLCADPNVPTLLDLAYRKHVKADSGGHGSSKRQRGADGADCVAPVPPGTLVFEAETGVLLRDLQRPGDCVVVAKGGRGGVGNAHRPARGAFKGWRSKEAQRGEVSRGDVGEERRVRLELKLVADVGIVGLPNAGKSTLLSAISAARPRIAPFPFTTTTPTLGTVTLPGPPTGRGDDGVRCVAVDVPGLIEGASRGRGLGVEFLRHVERTRVLLHLVDMAGSEGRDPLEDFRGLNAELAQYNHGVAAKAQLVVANKMDLPGATQHLRRFRRIVKPSVVAISARTGQGIPQLLTAVARLLREAGTASHGAD